MKRRTAIAGLMALACRPNWSAPAGDRAELITRRVPVSAFHRIHVSLPADVTLERGIEPGVRVRAEPAVIDRVVVRVRGRTLELFALDGMQTQSPLRIDVRFQDLSELESEGASDLTLLGLAHTGLSMRAMGTSRVTLRHLRLGTLRAEVSGAATVEASGEAERLQVIVKGSGEFDAEGLRADAADVDVADAAEARVWVRSTLVARASGTGSIYYKGRPRVHQQVRDAADIEPA